MELTFINKVQVKFVGWCYRESMEAYLTLLNLGEHAQRGLQYLSVSVHLSVRMFITSFSTTAFNKAINK